MPLARFRPRPTWIALFLGQLAINIYVSAQATQPASRIRVRNRRREPERRLSHHRCRFPVAAMRRRTDPVKLETMIRCLIVDDSALFLEAAASVLRRDGVTVAGTAGTIEDALQRAHELRPDVILIDVMLGSESGFDLARRLAETGPEATLILISTHDAADFAELIAATPAAGFVPKSELSADAIRRLVSGPRDR